MFEGVTEELLTKARAETDAEMAAIKLLRDGGYVVEFHHDGKRPADWRTMDTAPKDGTSMLVFIPVKELPRHNAPSSKWKMFSQRVIEARWIVPPADDKCVTISPFARELEAKFGGYWTADPRCIAPLRGMPTHWMPRPADPE